MKSIALVALLAAAGFALGADAPSAPPPRFEDLKRAPAARAPARRPEPAEGQRALPGKPANGVFPRQAQAPRQAQTRSKGRGADSQR